LQIAPPETYHARTRARSWRIGGGLTALSPSSQSCELQRPSSAGLELWAGAPNRKFWHLTCYLLFLQLFKQ
jgi:hypothetical protein